VDAAGSVYLTGYAGVNYPYTVTAPTIPIGPINSIFFFELPFLSKLDPSGQTLLFSVPVGGGGVQVDSHGAVYVVGGVGSGFIDAFDVPAVPALASVPTQCLPNNPAIRSSAYVSQVDAASGNALGSQFIQGSTLTASGIALGSTLSTVWIAGATALPDVPFTANALTIPNLGPTPGSGAYLGEVDFSQPQPPAGTPQIGCIVDSASLAPDGLGVPYQLLTILGTGLGPTVGASAADSSTTTLDGVNISFGSASAPLLYVSSNQINFAVPLVSQSPATMQLSVNGLSAPPRALPLTFANPSLFVGMGQSSSFGPVALALNGDGSLNSSSNPAQPGSTVSVFVNGLTPDPQFNTLPLELFTNNGWSVIDMVQANTFVVRVDLRVPSPLVNNFACSPTSVCTAAFTLSDISGGAIGQAFSSIGQPFGGVVYVNRAQ
jgi:uncharacterized protein (TIGR03437 family)